MTTDSSADARPGQTRVNAAPQRIALVALAGAVLLTLLVYWTGLSGPYLMDDYDVIPKVVGWLNGTQSLQQLLFGNISWSYHRALSMATLAANAAWLGATPHAFKLGNLLIHIACALAAYGWLASMLARDTRLATRRHAVAALIATAWLLHPVNVSTVLYSVQRMAQVATLCCLLGLWFYVHMRSRMLEAELQEASLLETPSTRYGLYLLVGIPLLTLLGIQGKQNAAILPVLCLVVEFAYFQSPRAWPWTLRTLFGVLVAIPCVLGIAVLALKPQALLGDYALYEFSPVERLLTQARVLCDYLGLLLAPSPPNMGVYTDDYAVSTGLLAPASTAIAVAVLVVVSALAVRLRARLPSLFAGSFLFLAAHAIESSLLPLELYYEHRNYLPAFGVLLAVAGVVDAVMRRLDAAGVRSGRIAAVGLFCLVAVLALQTHGRARVWGDPATLATSALQAHPQSVRAHLGYLSIAVNNEKAVYERALKASLASPNPRVRASAMMFRVLVDCEKGLPTTPAALQEVARAYPPHIDILEAIGFQTLAERTCAGLDDVTVADALVSVADLAVKQPESASFKSAMRNDAARLYARAGRWDMALRQGRMAWNNSIDLRAAEVLLLALLQNGDRDGANAVYQEAVRRTGRFGDERALQRLRDMLDAEGGKPAHAGPRPG